MTQVIVVDAILVVLEGHHGEGEGPHKAGALVGQAHLQGHRIAYLAGCCLTITRLPIHQHICRDMGHETVSSITAQWMPVGHVPTCVLIH